MKGVYNNMDSYWNENVLHLSIKNFERFNEMLKAVEDAKQEFDKALHKLKFFYLEIVFDDSAFDSSGEILDLSVRNLEQFAKELNDTEKAEQALNKAMHDLNCFNLKVVLDKVKASG